MTCPSCLASISYSIAQCSKPPCELYIYWHHSAQYRLKEHALVEKWSEYAWKSTAAILPTTETERKVYDYLALYRNKVAYTLVAPLPVGQGRGPKTDKRLEQIRKQTKD